MTTRKRKAVYNREADKNYLSTLSDEQKEEKKRRSAFTRAKKFILEKRYTSDEFDELYNLITERKNID